MTRKNQRPSSATSETASNLSDGRRLFANRTSLDRHVGAPPVSGIVVYAHADGSFSVLEPCPELLDSTGRFESSRAVPTGIRIHRGRSMGRTCRYPGRATRSGLHWVAVGLVAVGPGRPRQRQGNGFDLAGSVSRAGFGPDDRARTPMRLSVDDAREIPSIVTNYAGQVPIVHASSGIRRIVALAYILTWTWSEHRIVSELRETAVYRQVVMLFDEVESHLPSAMAAVDTQGVAGCRVRVSRERRCSICRFNAFAPGARIRRALVRPRTGCVVRPGRGRDSPRPHLHRRTYTRTVRQAHGSRAKRSTLSPIVIWRQNGRFCARAILRQTEPALQEVMTVHDELRATLPDVDRFWVRWNAFVEDRGGTP